MDGIGGDQRPDRKVALEHCDAHYQSETCTLSRDRNSNRSNSQTVSSFVVVNARVAYPLPMLGKDGEISDAAENLLSRDYSYRLGYPMSERWGRIGVSASF